MDASAALAIVFDDEDGEKIAGFPLNICVLHAALGRCSGGALSYDYDDE